MLIGGKMGDAKRLSCTRFNLSMASTVVADTARAINRLTRLDSEDHDALQEVIASYFCANDATSDSDDSGSESDNDLQGIFALSSINNV